MPKETRPETLELQPLPPPHNRTRSNQTPADQKTAAHELTDEQLNELKNQLLTAINEKNFEKFCELLKELEVPRDTPPAIKLKIARVINPVFNQAFVNCRDNPNPCAISKKMAVLTLIPLITRMQCSFAELLDTDQIFLTAFRQVFEAASMHGVMNSHKPMMDAIFYVLAESRNRPDKINACIRLMEELVFLGWGTPQVRIRLNSLAQNTISPEDVARLTDAYTNGAFRRHEHLQSSLNIAIATLSICGLFAQQNPSQSSLGSDETLIKQSLPKP